MCGLFPLDEKDLRERNFVMPEKKCGFYFGDTPDDNSNSNGNDSGTRPLLTSMPLRWGPPKRGSIEDVGTGNGKPRWMKGVPAIVWSYFHKPKGNGNGNGNGNGHSDGNGNGRH